MSLRWRLILILLPLTIISFVIIDRLENDEQPADRSDAPVPDFTMTDADSLSMNVDGNPETRLTAATMAHYEERGETELGNPQLEMFRAEQPSLYVRADRGWVTSGNEVILLKGNVRFWEPAPGGQAGNALLEITTSEARLYPQRDMAETDKAATLTTPDTVTDSVGMRAWLNEGRIELLSRVKTVIDEGKVRIGPSQ